MDEKNAQKPAEEKKAEDSENDKKKIAQAKPAAKKREEATAFGKSLVISLKHSMYLGKFIKNKKIDTALNELAEVVALRKAVPFKGEIPHRGEPGMMSGRYPQSAAREFIRVLKNLKGNAIAHGLELDATRIVEVTASWASRPMRRGGRKAKRTHIHIKAREVKQMEKKHG